MAVDVAERNHKKTFMSTGSDDRGPRRDRVMVVFAALVCLCAHGGRAETRADLPNESSTSRSSAGPLPAVSLDGNYFSRGGHRFIPVGANWVPAKAAMQWPTQWDPRAIESDFARMHELGIITIRLDFVWAWIEPRPGDYNPEAFRALDFLISLAHRYQIYLHPCLLIGGEVGEAYWDVPYRQGRHPHSDPDMLRIETDQCRRVGSPLREGDCNSRLGPDRRAALLDRCGQHHGCDGDQLDAAALLVDSEVRHTACDRGWHQHGRRGTRALSS